MVNDCTVLYITDKGYISTYTQPFVSLLCFSTIRKIGLQRKVYPKGKSCTDCLLSILKQNFLQYTHRHLARRPFVHFVAIFLVWNTTCLRADAALSKRQKYRIKKQQLPHQEHSTSYVVVSNLLTYSRSPLKGINGTNPSCPNPLETTLVFTQQYSTCRSTLQGCSCIQYHPPRLPYPTTDCTPQTNYRPLLSKFTTQ